ncbi:hypothetical protein CHISP_2221 [Chitinispirillum alkaliphilum]|nr:hypothetical protein CHISP_2221 [Chitinispirillum alkaliphilum]
MLVKAKAIARFLIVGGILISFGAGCSTTPTISQEDQDRLEEARIAAEEAERKLSELRQERIRLEQGVDEEPEADQEP